MMWPRMTHLCFDTLLVVDPGIPLGLQVDSETSTSSLAFRAPSSGVNRGGRDVKWDCLGSDGGGSWIKAGWKNMIIMCNQVLHAIMHLMCQDDRDEIFQDRGADVIDVPEWNCPSVTLFVRRNRYGKKKKKKVPNEIWSSLGTRFTLLHKWNFLLYKNVYIDTRKPFTF